MLLKSCVKLSGGVTNLFFITVLACQLVNTTFIVYIEIGIFVVS